MQLSVADIKQGILHPERIVRRTCIGHFSGSFSRDASLLPLIVRAIDEYGWEPTLGFPSNLGELPLTDETLVWAVEQLHRLERQEPPEMAFDWLLRRALSRLIHAADADLLARHETLVLGAPLADITPDDVSFKLGLRNLEGDVCWNRLDELLEEQCIYTVVDMSAPAAVSLLQRLAAEGDRFDARIVAELESANDARSTWLDDDTAELRMALMAELAGRRRLEAAIDSLLAVVRFENVMINDSCQRALIEIGTPRVLEELREAVAYSSGWLAKSFLFGVLPHLHVDGVVACCRELLERYENFDPAAELSDDDSSDDDLSDDDLSDDDLSDELLSLRSQLVLAMASQFDTDGFEIVAARFQDANFPEESVDADDIQERLVCGQLLLGFSCEGIETWRSEVEARMDAQSWALQHDAETSPLCNDDWDDGDDEDDEFHEEAWDDFDDEPSEEDIKFYTPLWRQAMSELTGKPSPNVPLTEDDLDAQRPERIVPERIVPERTAPERIVHQTPRVGRNDPCPCGSGKKFKKCCMKNDLHDPD